jgi:heat-inducible transcriptional repressor
MELSERRKELLRAIISEYIETAEPVGSDKIVAKYNLGVSPATVRNEMVVLSQAGYLKQPHTSAGRIPTPAGLKLYINELMKEATLPVKDEVSIKESLWDQRFEFHRLLREAARELSAKTGSLAIAYTEDGDVYYSGTANILDMPEFYDIDLTREVLRVIDRQEKLSQIFDRAVGDNDVQILIGEEIGQEFMDYCGVVFSPFGSGKKNAGVIGVIGPSRMEFQRVIPTVRYFGGLLTELSKSW